MRNSWCRQHSRAGQFLYANTNLTLDLPEYRMLFNHDRIADLGLDVNSVSSQLATMLAEMDANRFNSNGKAYRVDTAGRK